ncbi:hypothetical protein NM962_09730 [Mycobacterium sp. SVM_VP21]|nr:hypothetical protein NM962_09730 [Mycobacterium sp. SVM_VP21]
MSNEQATTAVPHRVELNEDTGRWLGERGIFRHFQPTDAEALQAAQDADEPVLHVMSTCLSGVYDGLVTGELVRWVHPDGELTYEARIRGLPQHGTTDLVAAELDELCDIAKVLQELRYEWGAMVVYEDWAVSRMSIYTGPRTGGA